MVITWRVSVTTPDQLRDIVQYLQNRVKLVTEDEKAITFIPPTAEEMTRDRLDGATVTRLISAPWWSEMVDDIIETPDYAEPDATPMVVLGYARDLIQEYIGKRFPLDT
jgi:hypothetical protein